MAGKKIDTTADTGGDRRRPDPDRINEREEAVTGTVRSGDRTAGREAGSKEGAGDVPTDAPQHNPGMHVGETKIGPRNDLND